MVGGKRETTLGRQLFYCASGNTRSLNFKLKCADVAAHTLINVVFKCCLFLKKVPPRNLILRPIIDFEWPNPIHPKLCDLRVLGVSLKSDYMA